MRKRIGFVITIAALAGATTAIGGTAAKSGALGAVIHPTVSDWQFLSSTQLPPSQSACNAVGRRCFNPAAMANSYNYTLDHTNGVDGSGTTIAIVDSFGSSTIASDLNNFDSVFGLQHLCGETGYTCATGDPWFKILQVQGSPPPNPPPSNNGTGQEAHNLWALEVSLDVEWAHATAPRANILLVTTPTAETLGVQGFSDFMNAEQYVLDHHMADVISQSFASGEAAFNSFSSLQNLRHAFISAQADHVTVFGSSGDGGTTNTVKEPTKKPATIPYPSVQWPASDPLVTGVGGTYLCTDATSGTFVDSSSPPAACNENAGAREVGWLDSGGGYSIYFSRPAFQNTLPPGSTYVGSSPGAPGPNSNMRGVPDISYQASSRTGALVYMTEPATTSSGTGCGGANPCSSGWYVVGGTSAGSPQWAGIAAMADTYAHSLGKGDVGYINPALYTLAANPATYANDFYDVTAVSAHFGCNQTSSIPGYCDSTGWDAVTGLGSPNVYNLIPDLVAAAAH